MEKELSFNQWCAQRECVDVVALHMVRKMLMGYEDMPLPSSMFKSIEVMCTPSPQDPAVHGTVLATLATATCQLHQQIIKKKQDEKQKAKKIRERAKEAQRKQAYLKKKKEQDRVLAAEKADRERRGMIKMFLKPFRGKAREVEMQPTQTWEELANVYADAENAKPENIKLLYGGKIIFPHERKRKLGKMMDMQYVHVRLNFSQ
jgi:hypothetical protein